MPPRPRPEGGSTAGSPAEHERALAVFGSGGSEQVAKLASVLNPRLASQAPSASAHPFCPDVGRAPLDPFEARMLVRLRTSGREPLRMAVAALPRQHGRGRSSPHTRARLLHQVEAVQAEAAPVRHAPDNGHATHPLRAHPDHVAKGKGAAPLGRPHGHAGQEEHLRDAKSRRRFRQDRVRPRQALHECAGPACPRAPRVLLPRRPVGCWQFCGIASRTDQAGTRAS